MSDGPSVSVLVTVYNREAYLSDCLASILASSWEDFELIVVDDGSADSSASIAESYASRDQRVRFYRNERNLGDYPNRMRAAEIARGTYLKYVDSDDLLYRHSLAIMVDAMNANPAAALGLSHSSSEEDGPFPWVLTPEEAWTREFLGSGCLSCGPSGAIIRREPFIETAGFRNRGVLSDIDLWYRMSARWPVLFVPHDLVFWRRHDDQEFTKLNAAHAYLVGGFELTLDALNDDRSPLSAPARTAALKRARQRHARRLISVALRQRRPRAALQLLRRSGLSTMDVLEGFKPYQ